jgi:hypothetical protein
MSLCLQPQSTSNIRLCISSKMDREPIITDHSDLLEVAHKRAPFEIWETIFNIAIESPLIPYLNDDIVDTYLLFSQMCASQRILKCIETIRNQLRLVCRSWNACLRDKGIRLVIRSFERGTYHRFEALDAFRCTCHRPCLGSILYPSTVSCSDNFHDPPARALANLRIGIISSNYPIDVLLNAPRLRALHIMRCSWSTRPDMFLSHRIILTLSHLQLSGLSLQSIRSITGPVNFPQLRLMSLGLTTGPRVRTSVITTIPSGPLEAWLLPCLQTLMLKGRVDADDEQDISKFLSRPWTGVTSLYVDLSYVARNSRVSKAFEITPSLWESFPNLVTFGTHPACLVKVPPAPPRMCPRFSLALEFMWDALQHGFTLRGRSMIPFIQVLDEWKPVNIIFLSSWEEIHTNWRKSHSSLSMLPKGLFSTALARDILLLDVNRTPMCDEDGLKCLEIILG